MRNSWNTRGGVHIGKNGVLGNMSGNIYETRKDGGKATMDGLYELTNALSNGTIPNPLRPPLPETGVCNLSQEQVKLRTSNLAGRPTFTRPIRIKAH